MAYYRYLCPGTESQSRATRCRSHSIRGPLLEGRIWDKLVSFLVKPELFLRALQETRERLKYGPAYRHAGPEPIRSRPACAVERVSPPTP